MADRRFDRGLAGRRSCEASQSSRSGVERRRAMRRSAKGAIDAAATGSSPCGPGRRHPAPPAQQIAEHEIGE
jgi:hypothetical protein